MAYLNAAGYIVVSAAEGLFVIQNRTAECRYQKAQVNPTGPKQRCYNAPSSVEANNAGSA
jgi:hypothetical protein